LPTKTRKGLTLTLPARASVFYTVSAALERGIGFVFTPIFTRALTAEEYGLYPLYTSWLGIFTIFVTLELTGNVIYRAILKFDKNEGAVTRAATAIMSAALIALLTLFIIFQKGITSTVGLAPEIIFFLILQAYLNGIMYLYLSKCRYRYEYKRASLVNLTLSVLAPSIAFLLVNFTRVRAEARIIAPLLVSLFICVIALPSLLRGSRGNTAAAAGYLIKKCLPLLPHFLATSVIAQTGKLVIGRYFGARELASYSIVFSMGFLFTLMTVGIQSGLAPWINRKLDSGDGEKIDETAKRVFSLLSLATLLGLCFSPEGLAFLAPPEYRTALLAVYPIGVSVLLGFPTAIINAIILYFEKGHYTTLSSLIGAFASITLNLTLTVRYGYFCAALVQAASSLVMLIASYLILLGVLKKRSKFAPSYLKGILFAALGATALGTLREVFLSRLLIFLALLVAIIPRVYSCRSLISER